MEDFRREVVEDCALNSLINSIPEKLKERIIDAIKSIASQGECGAYISTSAISSISKRNDKDCDIADRIGLHDLICIVYKPKKFFWKVIKVSEKNKILVDKEYEREIIISKIKIWLDSIGYTTWYSDDGNLQIDWIKHWQKN